MDKIVCLGKNYLAHARELGDAVPARPVLFLKPPSCSRAVANPGDTIVAHLPTDRGEIHHEIEIVLRIRNEGYRIQEGQGLHHVDAYTLGLDMTARAVQKQLKQSGHPWEIGKVFPDAAILGPWIPLEDPADLEDLSFALEIDGAVRQAGSSTDIGLPPGACVEWAAHHFPLCPGDAVFTGTPEGVGPVDPGQVGRVILGDTPLFTISWIAG